MIRIIATAALLCLAATATANAAKRVALVIGTDAYATLPKLNNAATDAKGMAKKLRSLGFDVILKVNAGERAIGRALADFEGRLAKAEVGLVFYAGHGIQSGGKNYLIPADAQIEVEEDLRYESIRAGDFLEAMERAGTPLNIVILDACRDNPLPKRSRSAARGLSVPIIPAGIKGTAILYSAAPGQTAQDGPKGGHGVFTGELLKVLGQPNLTLEKVFKETAQRVAAATNGKQDPWINSSVKGDFYFRSADSRPREKVTSSVPAGSSAEIVFWQSIQTSKNPADYADYLAQYPSGSFARLAKRRVNELKQPKAAAAKPAPSPPTRTEAPAATNQESLFWQSIKGSKNSADYQDYLMAFPNGTFARLAKRRMQELRRRSVAVARPRTPVRSRGIEKLRGYRIWVQTRTDSLGQKYCKLFRDAGLIVRCSTYADRVSSERVSATVTRT